MDQPVRYTRVGGFKVFNRLPVNLHEPWVQARDFKDIFRQNPHPRTNFKYYRVFGIQVTDNFLCNSFIPEKMLAKMFFGSDHDWFLFVTT